MANEWDVTMFHHDGDEKLNDVTSSNIILLVVSTSRSHSGANRARAHCASRRQVAIGLSNSDALPRKALQPDLPAQKNRKK